MKCLSFLFTYLTVSVILCDGLEVVAEGEKNNNGPGLGWHQQLPPGIEVPGPCIDPSQIKLATNVDPNFVDGPKNFYYAGGSKFGMNLYAQALLGRNPHSLHEFSEMCPEVFIFSPELRFVSGYGRIFEANCFSQDANTTVKCYRNNAPTTYDEGVDPNLGIQNKKYYLTETDNKNYMIFLTCANDQYADYQLVTTRPYVSPSEAEAFVKQIKAANFPLSQSILLACQIKKSFLNHYPYPFGSYPISPSDYQENPGHGWSLEESNKPTPSGPPNGWSHWESNNPAPSGGPPNGWPRKP